MKILIVSDCYKPAINGVVTSILNLKSGLEDLGHEVRVLTLANTKKSYRENEVYYIGSADMAKIYPGVTRVQICNTRKEVSNIVKWAPDIIHTQSEFCTFFIARKIANKLSIPIIHTYHTVYEDYTHYFSTSKTIGKKAVVKLTNYHSSNVTGMVAPTEKINNILDRYGVSCPVHIIPTGISLEKFQKKVDDSVILDIKKELGIPEDYKTLLSVSRIGKEKNIDELIKYMNKLRDKKVALVIVGDGPAKPELEGLVKELDLSATVKFTGSVPPDVIPRYYQMANLFVSASTSETQGLTYIEALASATPILCRKDTCLDGVLEEFENGYSFENQKEFLDKLEIFMTNKDSGQMAINAEETAKKFTTENFAKSVVNLYQVYIDFNRKRHGKNKRLFNFWP